MLQSRSEQFRFGDMTEEHADVVKPARFGIGERRREKSLRVVVDRDETLLGEKRQLDPAGGFLRLESLPGHLCQTASISQRALAFIQATSRSGADSAG